MLQPDTDGLRKKDMKRYLMIAILIVACSGAWADHDLSNKPVKVNDGTAAAPGVYWEAEGEMDGFYSAVEGEEGIGVSVDQLSVGRFLSTGWNGAVVGAITGNTAGVHTGAVSFPAGSAAAPSIYPTGDTDTGVYSAGADTLNFATGGTLRLSLSATLLTSTLPLVMPAGAAASPSIYPAGDTNTGLYWAGADQINFTTGGVLRLSLSDTDLTSAVNIAVPDGAADDPSIYFESEGERDGFYSSVEGEEGIGVSVDQVTAGQFLSTGWHGDVVGDVTGDSDGVHSGTVSVDDGSAAAPSIYFTSDTNTGIYSRGADDIAIAAGGVEKLVVNTAGMSAARLLTPSGGSAAAPGLDISGLSGYGLYQTGSALGVSVAGASVVNWTSGTQTWDVEQWDDANVGTLQLGSGGTAPGKVEWLNSAGGATGIYTIGFDINDQVSGAIEIPHSYKEGSDIYFHAHGGIINAPSGTDYVKFNLIYSVTSDDDLFPAATTISKEIAVTTQYTCYALHFAAITGTNFDIGDQFNFTLQRVTAAGAAFAGEYLSMTVGLHYLSDTLGSSTIGAK